MKILQVISSFPPAYSYGGAATVAYDISKELVKKGHDVTVYTTDVYDEITRLKYESNPIFLDGIQVYHFKNISNKLSRKNLTIAPGMITFLKKNIRNYEIIHIHEYRTFQSIFAQYFAKKYNIPYLLQSHGTLPKIIKWEKLKSIFDATCGSRIIKNASKLFALNETEVKQYLKLGADVTKIKIVPNGIDISKYNDISQKGDFRIKYSLRNEQIVLYVGRLHESKGIDLLIESFAELSYQLRNIKLVIVGPDEGYQNYLIQLTNNLGIKDKVIFTGFISISEKKSAYRDSDVFVTPCFSGFPITFLESCVYGLPIITTTKGDNLPFIDNKIGYVVDYSTHQLCDAMFRVLTNSDENMKFKKNCRKLVEEEYNLSIITNNIETIYKKIMDSKSY